MTKKRAAPKTRGKAFNKLRKAYGEDASESNEIRRFVTKIPGLNRVSGLGGIPMGRVVGVWGPYRGGKSTLSVRVLADCAAAGGIAVYYDVERAAIKPWFRACGLEDESYIFRRPLTQEECQDEILDLLRDVAEMRKSVGGKPPELPPEAPVVIVVDTVTKFIPADKLKGKIGSKDYGLSANLVNDWLKSAVVLSEIADATLWLVLQERVDRGFIWNNGRGFPGMPAWMKHRPTNGDALLFDMTLGLRISATKTTKQGDKKVGKQHEIRVMKSKLGPDLSAAGLGQWFTSNGEGDCPKGIDIVRELIAEGLEVEAITKPSKGKIAASWSDEVWSGEARFRKALRDPEKSTFDDLFAAICEKVDDIARDNGHDV